MGFQDFVSGFTGSDITFSVTPDGGLPASSADRIPSEAANERLLPLTVDVYSAVNKIPTATITFSDGQPNKKDFALANDPRLTVGAGITINCGPAGHQEPIFYGIIQSQTIESRQHSSPCLRVELQSPAVRLTAARRLRAWDGVGDRQLLRELVLKDNEEDTGLKFEFPDGTIAETTYPHMVQYNVTNWDFLVMRAERIGRVVVVDGTTVRVVEPSAVEKDAVILTYGTSQVLEMESQISAEGQNIRYEFKSIDAEGNEMAGNDDPAATPAGTVPPPSTDTPGPEPLNGQNPSKLREFLDDASGVLAKGIGASLGQALVDKIAPEDATPSADPDAVGGQNGMTREEIADVSGSPVQTQFTAATLDEAELNSASAAGTIKSKFSRIRGRVRAQATTLALPGQTLQLDGVGSQHGAIHYIAGVRYNLGAETKEIDIQFGLSPHWFADEHHDIVEMGASGLVAPVEGLVIGTVLPMTDTDPLEQFRIKVRVPGVSESGPVEHWASVSTLHAGDDHSSMWLPEENDTVVLGFFGNDPRDPVILGCLHRKAQPAPEEFDYTTANTVKGFVTKGGTKILFTENDEANSIHLELPNASALTLSDADDAFQVTDHHGNTILMNKDGISFESSKDIKLVAGAGGEIALEGTNLTGAFDGKLSLDATSAATVSTSGFNTVQGSTVHLKTS